MAAEAQSLRKGRGRAISNSLRSGWRIHQGNSPEGTSRGQRLFGRAACVVGRGFVDGMAFRG